MMYENLPQDARCYWVILTATLLSFVGFIVTCICSCRHNENKNEFMGLAGMVTINPDSEVFETQPTSELPQIILVDTVDGGKRASGANRSLPDIPKDRNVNHDGNGIRTTPQDIIYEAAEIVGDQSELYATVQDKSTKQNNQCGTRANSQESSSLQEEDSTYPYAKLNKLNSSTDEHPYAQVQNVQKAETSRQNRNPSQLKDSINQTTNPIAPPRSRRASSHNSLLNLEASTSEIQAANAITGGVQANQDLPYMTPPLLIPLPRLPLHHPEHNINNSNGVAGVSGAIPHQNFSGDSQDSKGYTSISVREPLANIIAQTKAANQQTHRQNPHRNLTDSHYATVSDDSDEMYAAIDEQEKIYTSGSETYAQIQPTINEQNRLIQPEQPSSSHPINARIINEESSVFLALAHSTSAPHPPSVNSLRHVAYAHSRQASSSSATSSIINPGSPKPEKRQANSPLPPPPPPPPLPIQTTNQDQNIDIYASIDKHSKPININNEQLQILNSGKSLEDMYAKVTKKKRDLEEDFMNNKSIPLTLDSNQIIKKTNPNDICRSSWSSHDSGELQKRDSTDISNRLLNVTLDNHIEFNKVARKYELDRITPEQDFESMSPSQRNLTSINDPNYEILRPIPGNSNDLSSTHQYSSSPPASAGPGTAASSTQSSTNNLRNGIDILSFYSVPFKHRQISNASSEDPGYEKVRICRRIDLDSNVDTDLDSEPNYESMPPDTNEPNYASVFRPNDSDTDPNYESVNRDDPNYESVRYISVSKNLKNDPPYEQVNLYKDSKSIDGYEKVKSKVNDDPNYEKINSLTHTLTDNTDTDDEQYIQV